jgi:two-component system response regulator MprA
MNNIKILLVEDSETQLQFLKKGLTDNGFEVEIAQNGAEAYKKVFECAPDIVVSDIMMPAIDGYQLCYVSGPSFFEIYVPEID